MSSVTDTPTKKHKKHKKDKDKSREERDGTPTLPGTPGSNRLKLILKVGGSSTPEHSDSPGPPSTSLSVLNVYDEDSQQSNSNLSISQISHGKKSKKKDKKNKKEKKHKHRHKEKRKRERDEAIGDASAAVLMDIDSMESASPASALIAGNSNRSVTLGEIGLGSPSSQSQYDLDAFPGSVGANQEPEFVEQKPVIPYKQKPGEKQPFQKLLDHLLRALQKKDPQMFFAWPVTDSIAPGYSSIIKEPMDFSTMKTKIDEGTYNTLPEFTEDFKLMCNNAMVYNGPETIYYKAAKKILQSGIKILDPERIRTLLPLIPSIRVLSEEALGFCLIPEQISQDNLGSQSEEDNHENICLDPTKSIHYVPPHPNDPPDLSGAFSDDLTTEEILQQARIAAREAAHRLATKKPNSKMGFLRQRTDGSTSLAILTPTNGVMPGTQEQPVTLNVVAGKLSQGTTQLQGYKDDRKNIQRTVKPLYYGAFSSFAPCLDSTFANLTSVESDMVRATYGEETSVQYAESMVEFAKGCDYAMIMVDELLDTITKGEHKKVVNVIEERKRMEEEEALLRKEQSEFAAQLEMEWENATGTATTQNLDSLHSLNELGIDTSFIDNFTGDENAALSERLKETAQLIGDLQKVQSDRLRLPSHPLPPHVSQPSDEELRLAERITENLTDMTKSVPPGSIISEDAIRKVMGIDIDSATFNFIAQTQEESSSKMNEQVPDLPVPVESNNEVNAEIISVPMDIQQNQEETSDDVDLLAKEVAAATASIASQEVDFGDDTLPPVANIIETSMECVVPISLPPAETTTVATMSVPSEEPVISSTTSTPPENVQIGTPVQQQERMFM